MSRKLDPAKQQAFIDTYTALLKTLPDDEAVMFADAVHPTHGARPVGCWAPKEVKVAVDQTSGRDRLNLHGALDLETGRTRMIEVVTVDALSTIALLVAIEAPGDADHPCVSGQCPLPPRPGGSGLVGPARPADPAPFRAGLLPASEPDRASLMHKTVTHNRCHATYNGFCEAVLGFLRNDVPSKWHMLCDRVTDNFRITSPEDFRVLR